MIYLFGPVWHLRHALTLAFVTLLVYALMEPAGGENDFRLLVLGMYGTMLVAMLEVNVQLWRLEGRAPGQGRLLRWHVAAVTVGVACGFWVGAFIAHAKLGSGLPIQWNIAGPYVFGEVLMVVAMDIITTRLERRIERAKARRMRLGA